MESGAGISHLISWVMLQWQRMHKHSAVLERECLKAIAESSCITGWKFYEKKKEVQKRF